jgi:hypothetical protein
MQKQPLPTSWFEKLSDSALIKLDRIVKTPNNPDPLIDTSRSTWWRWVAAGTAPEPVRPTAGTTLWRVGDLRRFLKDPEQFITNVQRSKGAKQ